MAEEKLIQVNLQLPASELASLTALAEQLQKLLSVGSQTASLEQEENSDFDTGRFHTLENTEKSPAETAGSSSGEIPTTAIALSDTPKVPDPAISDFSSTIEAPVSEAPLWSDISAQPFFTEVEEALPTPSSAGGVISDVNPLPFTQNGNRTVEQLITSAPAPLTAEAVSMAFRRDDRRYDNGFPLY